jgi:hypothetical protein
MVPGRDGGRFSEVAALVFEFKASDLPSFLAHFCHLHNALHSMVSDSDTGNVSVASYFTSDKLFCGWPLHISRDTFHFRMLLKFIGCDY